MRYVHNCLGLWEIFFSVVVLSYCIPTNYFNFVISMWFGVVIAVIDLQMDTTDTWRQTLSNWTLDVCSRLVVEFKVMHCR